jgi:hypothetical protein
MSAEQPITSALPRASAAALCSFLTAAACGGAAPPAQPPAAAPPAASAPAAPAQPDSTAPIASEPSQGAQCGALDCRRFSDAASALSHVLRAQPLALGIGEAHAQAGSEGIPTTAARFSEQLLPLLAGRASHIIVELLRANPACPAAARPLEQAQKPVIAGQSKNNQNDYVQIGVRAKALGIEPFLLTPSCEEFQAIADAGEDTIPVTLATIAKITTRMVKGALLQNQKAGRERIVVAYGGALHNDLQASDLAARDLSADTPPSPREHPLELPEASFRYGDELNQFTRGRYIALDLVVRELIKDNPAWRTLPWFAAFDPHLHPDSYIVLRTSPHSYVLFFPGAAPRIGPAPSAPGAAQSPAK